MQHATPASAYAHTPSRFWYSDANLKKWHKEHGCKDIAEQLYDLRHKIQVWRHNVIKFRCDLIKTVKRRKRFLRHFRCKAQNRGITLKKPKKSNYRCNFRIILIFSLMFSTCAQYFLPFQNVLSFTVYSLVKSILEVIVLHFRYKKLKYE